MSWNLEIRADIRLVVTRFEGAVDYDDFRQWLEEAPRYAGFSKAFDGLMDVRDVVYKHARPEKVDLLASQMIEQNFTTGRWAVLVSGPTATALSLHYSKKASTQHPIQVFSTIEAAAQFLNRPPDAIGYALRPRIDSEDVSRQACD